MLIYVNIWHLQAGFIYFYLLYFISFFDQPISYTELFRTFDKSTSQNTNIYMQTKTEFHFSVLPGKLIEKFFFFLKSQGQLDRDSFFFSKATHPTLRVKDGIFFVLTASTILKVTEFKALPRKTG